VFFVYTVVIQWEKEVAVATKGEATRQKILEVAERTFARQGYAGARLDDISGALGLTRQSLLFYFKDKGGLYQAVLENLFDKHQSALTQRARNEFASLEGYIDYQIENTLESYLIHPEFPMMMLRFIQGEGPRAEEVHPAAMIAVNIWDQILQEGGASGQTRKVPLENLVAVVGGTLSYYLLMPQAAQAGHTLMKYDPRAPANVRKIRRNLQLAVRGMLGLTVEVVNQEMSLEK